MQAQEFISNVQMESGLDSPEAAERIVAAVFETLGERLPRTRQAHLAAQMPKQLQALLQQRLEQAVFTMEEFHNRVASRAQIGFPEARRDTLSVLKVLRKAVSLGELRHVFAELPLDYQKLLEIEES